MSAIVDRVREEPAAVTFFVQAAIGLGMAFGLEWTAEQVAAVLTFTGAILWLFLRAKVVPEAKIKEYLASLKTLDEGDEGDPSDPE